MSLRSSVSLGVVLIALFGACSGTSGGSAACSPGASIACACPGGALGVQTCRTDYRFDPCACAGSPVGGDGGVPRDAQDPVGDADVTTPGGPTFLTAGTSATSITVGESVAFTTVLSDPDGIDDLIGGALKSVDGAITYGSFQTSSAEGAYSLRLTWDQIQAAKDITFTTDETRGFVLEFFDTAGHRATRQLGVRLHCSGKAACSGRCFDLQKGSTAGSGNVTHCGACGRSCSAKTVCTQGECAVLSACAPVASGSGVTCDAYCASKGNVCAEQGCNSKTATFYEDSLACGADPTGLTGSVGPFGKSCALNISALVPAGATVYARCCCVN